MVQKDEENMGFDIARDVPDSDVRCRRCPGFINIWDKAGGDPYCWNCKVELEKEMDAINYPKSADNATG